MTCNSITWDAANSSNDELRLSWATSIIDLPSPNKSPVFCVDHIWVFTLAIAVESEKLYFQNQVQKQEEMHFNIVCTSEVDPRSKALPLAVYPSIIDCFADPKGSELLTVSEDSIFSIELIIT